MNVSDTIQTAMAHHRAGRVGEAASIYERIIDESPLDAQALRLLGILRASQQQYEEAEGLLKRALEAAPEFAAAHSSSIDSTLAKGPTGMPWPESMVFSVIRF